MKHHNSHAPLRLLLVADGNTVSTWLGKCVQDCERSGAATCVLVLRTAPEEARGVFRFLQRLRQFLFWLYQNVDRRLFRSFPDAHALIDLRSALPNCRVLDGADLRSIEEQLRERDSWGVRIADRL